MNTVDLHGAAALLFMHPEVLRRWAKIGKIPGAKIGKRWVFVTDDLVNYLRSQYAWNRQALQVTSRKESTCHFRSAEQPGGSNASLQMESEYKNLLGLATKPSRKNTSTIAK